MPVRHDPVTLTYLGRTGSAGKLTTTAQAKRGPTGLGILGVSAAAEPPPTVSNLGLVVARSLVSELGSR